MRALDEVFATYLNHHAGDELAPLLRGSLDYVLGVFWRAPSYEELWRLGEEIQSRIDVVYETTSSSQTAG